MFLPHLLGERGGGLRPRARGALLGITLAHERPDVIRAVLEGTALWLRQLFEPHLVKLEDALFVASGGGANSPLWVEIVASMLDREIGLLATSDGGLRGMAILATVGLDIDTDLGGVSRRWTGVQATVKPNVDLVAAYAPIARRFAEAEALLSQMEMWDQENKGG
jgi:xylulokinase